AVDKAHNGAELILRGYFKGKGPFGPLYLDRIFDDDDEPIGYERMSGEKLLCPEQRELLARLRSQDVWTIDQIADIAGSRASAYRLLGIFRSFGLVSSGDKGTLGRNRRKLYDFSRPRSSELKIQLSGDGFEDVTQ